MNVVMIGDGYWSGNFKRTIKSNFPSLKISHIVDPLTNNKAPGTVNLKDYKDLKPFVDDIDFAIVCSPTITHYEIVKFLLENNIHTLVEKPITNNVDEANKLFSIADKKNVCLMVDHIYLYNASIQMIKKIIDRGDLGNLIHLSFYRTNLGPIRTDVSALWDLTTHDVSILNNFINKKYKKIAASGFKRKGTKVHDMVNASIEYDNLFVTLFSSWLHPSKERIIKIVGDKKMLIFDEMNSNEKIKIYDKKIDNLNKLQSKKYSSQFSFNVGNITIPFIKESDPLSNVLNEFIYRITNKVSNKSSKSEAIRVVETLENIESKII